MLGWPEALAARGGWGKVPAGNQFTRTPLASGPALASRARENW
jgi:hypothetical protein